MPYPDSCNEFHRNIIFDLDGTLIDSAKIILNCLDKAIQQSGNSLKKELIQELIGPPLEQVLSYLTETRNLNEISKMVDLFKKYYDDEGFKLTQPYQDIENLLKSLKQNNFVIYIATNKRLIPTIKTIEFLGWSDYFNKIYAIDSVPPKFKNKSHILKEMIKNEKFIIDQTIYIGDRNEDFMAAKENNLDFIYVNWGYGGQEKNLEIKKTVRDVVSLFTLLNLPT